MKSSHRLFTPSPLAAALLSVCAALGACSSMPADNALLVEARGNYRQTMNDPQTRELAAPELRQAGTALALADAAWQRDDPPATVTQLAHLAKQQTALAQETARRRAAELSSLRAQAESDRLRLAARTSEVDAARVTAGLAQNQAQAALQQNDAAQARNRLLESWLRDMNAKQTERGPVITIGDLLFDSNRSELRPEGLRSIDKLVDFMTQYPQRRALIEGFTDDQGGSGANHALSDRRADAVRMALVGRGIGRDRLDTRGYGEDHPVAGNDSQDGRRQNRRVEILLSDDRGQLLPR
ncbi:OmpA family protein [Roseateles sp. DAIF2]|uniref:OmpA family protein n=1 Tax=Roseateles sp. DAIF2 TaxID=2714952 RepID=UPI0018A25F9D|nr:OmpA family protein [Roseateles sp. DAIF2]QPF74048.1 OmpA family protein [Roseateles sp. DAIF2]